MHTKTEWRVQASATGRWDEDTLVLFSMMPGAALEHSGLNVDIFWRDVETKVRARARMTGLGEEAVKTYLRRARSNPGNWVALLMVCGS